MFKHCCQDYDFDWNRMLGFEGGTGPYLQYTHARMCGIERKTGISVSPGHSFTTNDAF